MEAKTERPIVSTYRLTLKTTKKDRKKLLIDYLKTLRFTGKVYRITEGLEILFLPFAAVDSPDLSEEERTRIVEESKLALRQHIERIEGLDRSGARPARSGETPFSGVGVGPGGRKRSVAGSGKSDPAPPRDDSGEPLNGTFLEFLYGEEPDDL